jgi:hypothetical protein
MALSVLNSVICKSNAIDRTVTTDEIKHFVVKVDKNTTKGQLNLVLRNNELILKPDKCKILFNGSQFNVNST